MRKIITILLVMLSIVGLSSCLGGVEFELNFVVDSETYDTVSTNGKEIVKMPSDPTKDGYTFDGWYWDKDEWSKPFTANSLLEAPLSSNMSVYAKWNCVHSASDWIIDTEATCKVAGSKHKECTECEAVLETEEIEKLTTHTPADAVKEDFVDSTCKTEGSYNSVVYCSVCEAKLLSETKTVDKKEHTPSEWMIDTEATCKAAGSKHKECTECEEVLETEEIEKLTTHIPAEAVRENFVDSDCKTEGSYNSVVYCSVCEAKLLSEAKTVDKKEHTPSEWMIDTEATCKAAGSKHKECTECKEVLEIEEIEKLTTHTPADAVKEDFVDSTCEAEGSYNSVVYCSVCEAKISSEAKVVEKKEHTPSDWIEDVAATCKAAGSKHKECTECEEVLETEEIEKFTTHIPAEAVRENFVDSDCKTEGSYNSVVYCSVCEAKLLSEAKTVDKKEHTPSDWIEDVAATCKAAGSKHKECTECKEVLEIEEIEKLTTHTPADAVKEDFVDSTCEVEGSYNSVVYCSVCEAKLSSEAKTVEKKAHTSSDWIIDTEATCKAAGSKHKECTKCEEVLETEEIEKLTTHTYTDDTDTDCNICGEKREIACQHNNTTIIPGKSASCTESGLTDGLICDDCKHTIVAQTEIPPSHKEVIIPRIEPECNICGWTEGKECSECYEVIIPQKPIKELGCTGGDWIIGMAPTDFDPGERYKICIRCGEVTSVEIIPPYNENDGSNGLDYEFSEDTVVITGIGSYADTKLVIPSTIRGLAVVGISEGAFKDCTNLTNVIIANSVTYIGNNAFENCSGVKAITLPDTIKSIGDYAFKDCGLIGEIKIPASVIEIGKGIFDGATKLGTVYYNSDASPSNSIFASTNISNVVFGGTIVPEYILNSATHVYSITISDSVTSVGKAAFSDCTSLSSVTIGKNVKVIGELAFCGCSKIKSIAVPDSVTSIGYSAFSSCSMLQTITLSSNLTTIESYAFEWCISLKSIDLPYGVTVIKEGAFQWCSNLSSITLPKTIKNIERNTFYQCTLLKIVYYYGSATEWSDVIIGGNNAPLTSANKEYKG